MDPILGGAILEGISRGAKGYQTYSAQKDLFDEDAAKRLKELERMEAINMLGGDIQTYQSQQMTPVQGAMREARERMAQDISSQDLSGGAYFRGQQAMTEAAGQERAAAQARAQEQYRREEEINRAEMESLKKRKKVADNAARDAFLAGLEGVDKSGQAYMMMETERAEIEALKLLAGKGMTPEEIRSTSLGWKFWQNKNKGSNFVRGQETFPGLPGLPDSTSTYDSSVPDEMTLPGSGYRNVDELSRLLGE